MRVCSPQDTTLQTSLNWSLDSERLPKLHLVSVGVSSYQTPNYQLHYAHLDAEAIYNYFAGQDATLWFRKEYRTLLTNDKATKRKILDALNEIRTREEVDPGDFVLVSISGHGEIDEEGKYYFLPSGYDDSGNTATQLAVNAINQGDLLTPLEKLTAQKKCHVLLVLDTCHSGAILHGKKGPPKQGELDQAVHAALQDLQQSEAGMVIIAACQGKERANELDRLKHGVLTFALLEGLQGRLLEDVRSELALPLGPIVYLVDLNEYVDKRVKELTASKQGVVFAPLDGISLGRIPLIVRRAAVER